VTVVHNVTRGWSSQQGLRQCRRVTVGYGAQCEILLPAIAALVRASPPEFKALRAAVQAPRTGAGWWPK